MKALITLRRKMTAITIVCLALVAFGNDKVPNSSTKASVDLRPEFTRLGLGPRAQGKRNTCSVFVTTETLEFALAKKEQQGKPLSVEYLNWACNEVINNHKDDTGQFFHNLLNGFDKYGICYESDMPYIDHFDPALAPSDDAKRAASKIHKNEFKIHWIKKWDDKSGLSDDQMREVRSVLVNGLPVAAGSNHSRLFVGFRDDASQPGGGVFITSDSGLGRYAEVTYEFARTKVNDAFWVELR